MSRIYEEQPDSAKGIWNRVEYRPLEGFVYAITPFNFTAIAGNLPASAAMMGNVVVWKPSDSQIFSAKVIIDVFREAGLPAGVINVVYGDPVMITKTILDSPDFAGLHFTGSTFIFKELWKQIGNNIHIYKNLPKNCRGDRWQGFYTGPPIGKTPTSGHGHNKRRFRIPRTEMQCGLQGIFAKIPFERNIEIGKERR